MRTLALDEIRSAVRGTWRTRGDAVRTSGISTDTRAARAGDLFIALCGEKYDGHDFLAAAAKAGCVSAMVERNRELSADVLGAFPGSVIGVTDTGEALCELGGWYRRMLAATVVAVTGSNGKTTTKRMIHHILQTRLVGTCSPKSFNNAIGVPLTLLGAGTGDDYVVCELGTSAPGEIAALARRTGPDIAVITSVGPTHLEKLGSIEGVVAEKASLLGYLDDGGIAVVWADDELLERATKPYEGRLIRFGTDAGADLRLSGYESDGLTQRFQINGRLWVNLPMPGRHNALNAIAAIAVARRFGLDEADAAAALADFPGTEMRMQAQQVGPLQVINDAYNANPASMIAAVEVLADISAERRILVLGDMRELGADAKGMHRQLGRQVAATRPDLVIGVGALGKYIAEGAAASGVTVLAFKSVRQAAGELSSLLAPGDAVLLKGSRGMRMEKLLTPIRGAFETPSQAGKNARESTAT